MHHCCVIRLKQDVCATQPPLESLQGKENSLQLEKVYMKRRLITRHFALAIKGLQPTPRL